MEPLEVCVCERYGVCVSVCVSMCIYVVYVYMWGCGGMCVWDVCKCINMVYVCDVYLWVVCM